MTGSALRSAALSPSSGIVVRILAGVSFWICLLPVLMGAMTLLAVPKTASHYRQGIHTPGTDSYHRDMQRGLVETDGNAAIRMAGIVLLAGFAVITIWPVRWLQCVVWVGAVLTAAAHLLFPVVLYGPLMMISWLSPFYFLPAGAGILSAVSLWLIRHPASAQST